MIAYFGCGGSMSGVEMGASISVTTSEATLTGKACLLKFGGAVVRSVNFNVYGIAVFTDLKDIGTYTIYASDGTSEDEQTVEIWGTDVINMTQKNVEVGFSAPLPVANIGDVISIAGHNCMCIGENRYVLMAEVSEPYSTWANAKTYALSWSDQKYTDVSAVYDVSDRNLMTLAEANGLPSDSVRMQLCNVLARDIWLLDGYGSSNAYVIYYSGGGYTTYIAWSGAIRGVLPAFTISKK